MVLLHVDLDAELIGAILFTVTATVVFAQTGSTATQGNSTAANRTEIHLHNYGEFNRACVAWTDGCRNCSRDWGCSNIGIACQPTEVTCLQQLPVEKSKR
jgi:hypothetical protein